MDKSSKGHEFPVLRHPSHPQGPSEEASQLSSHGHSDSGDCTQRAPRAPCEKSETSRGKGANVPSEEEIGTTPDPPHILPTPLGKLKQFLLILQMAAGKSYSYPLVGICCLWISRVSWMGGAFSAQERQCIKAWLPHVEEGMEAPGSSFFFFF